MYVIHPQRFLSISTLQIMPLGTDGLACNQVHTLWTPFWMAAPLNWLGKPAQKGSSSLTHTRELQKNSRDAFLILISFLDAGIWGLSFLNNDS